MVRRCSLILFFINFHLVVNRPYMSGLGECVRGGGGRGVVCFSKQKIQDTTKLLRPFIPSICLKIVLDLCQTSSLRRLQISGIHFFFF